MAPPGPGGRLVVAARAAASLGRLGQARALLNQQKRIYTHDRWQKRADLLTSQAFRRDSEVSSQ